MENQVKNKKDFGNTLIAGAGPAAIQIAVQLNSGFSKRIGFYNRTGFHADRLREELKQNQYEVSLTVQGSKIKHRARIDRLIDSTEQIQDEWETLILSTPCHSYGEVMDSLKAAELKRLKTIILISPNIGSNDLVKGHLNNNRVEVLSMSTYFAATKHTHPDTVIQAHTKTYKKRIYMASSKEDSEMLALLKQFLEELEVDGIVLDNPVEAECRNITTYVHPPLFMNAFALEEIFQLHNYGKKYMYKLYPEGPITQKTIKTMVGLWKDISRLIESLGAEPINLLKFLNDDNYPVPEVCLSREHIEDFCGFEEIKQEYLLYIRYSSILIDPYSKPDHNGRYFDFSAVPFKKAVNDKEGRWSMPRIPFEDYQKLKVLYGISQRLGLHMPTMKTLIESFKLECRNVENKLGIKNSLLHPWEENSFRDVEAFMQARGIVS